MSGTLLPKVTMARANRRETLLWIGAASVIVTSGAVIAMLGVYTIPTPRLVAIGNISDFPHSAPPRLITVDNKQVFIVTMATEILAFDPMVDYSQSFRCPVRWVESNHRFEEPCGGSKFFMDGRWLEGPALRNLDRYLVVIDRDGTVRIETWRTIKGDPHP